MFSDEEIKEMPENSFMRPGDEIIRFRCSIILEAKLFRGHVDLFSVVFYLVIYLLFHVSSIREVCLIDKFDKKDLGFSESLLSSSGKNDVRLFLILLFLYLWLCMKIIFSRIYILRVIRYPARVICKTECGFESRLVLFFYLFIYLSF